MLSLPAQIAIFVCTTPIDFRKQHDGLVAVVREELDGDPLDGSLFAFFNRRRDRIKLLLWDRNGFWLFYKRLERGTFQGLRSSGATRLRLSRTELSMLLDGIQLTVGKKRAEFTDVVCIDRCARERNEPQDRPASR